MLCNCSDEDDIGEADDEVFQPSQDDVAVKLQEELGSDPEGIVYRNNTRI